MELLLNYHWLAGWLAGWVGGSLLAARLLVGLHAFGELLLFAGEPVVPAARLLELLVVALLLLERLLALHRSLRLEPPQRLHRG